MTIINPLPITLQNGLTADATQVMADLNAIVTDANNNAAHSGANSDITSLSSLSTALSVSQGGTGSKIGPVLRGWLAGLTTSNNAGTPNTKVDIAAGQAVDSTNAVLMASAGTLTIDFGVVGANGLDVGAIGASAWYHIFLIGQAGGTTAGLASLSLTPALPGGYSYYRRIGSVKTDGSSHIITYSQFGSQFQWLTPILDVNSAAIGTTAVTPTLSIPTGVKTFPLITMVYSKAGATVAGFTSSPDVTDIAASGASFATYTQAAVVVSNPTLSVMAGAWLRSNTSAQLRFRCDNAGASYSVNTFGWVDDLGRSS